MHATELELLAIQAQPTFDPRGRIIGSYGVTIACTEEGQAIWIGAELPDELAGELAATFGRAASASRPDAPPPALEACARLLETPGHPLQRFAGPSFVIPPDTHFASAARIARSDRSDRDALRAANPGNWLAIEWDELLDGRLGPWAIATERERIVSICHTPGPVSDRGAECGVWTLPAARGRGHAAATTAAWAAIMQPTGRHLFYSTDADNRSSQQVARRLRLRPLGWTWRLARPRHEPAVHPLSSLRHR